MGLDTPKYQRYIVERERMLRSEEHEAMHGEEAMKQAEQVIIPPMQGRIILMPLKACLHILSCKSISCYFQDDTMEGCINPAASAAPKVATIGR